MEVAISKLIDARTAPVSEKPRNGELAARLQSLADRLMATTEHHQYAGLVLEAKAAVSEKQAIATSDPEGHRQAIADGEHDIVDAEARRYRWLRGNLYGADFQYGPADEQKIAVLLFRLPEGMRVSANLDATIDGAPK
jgi:hypothetical protein